MADAIARKRKRQKVLAVVLGIFSIASYVVLFVHQDAVTENFTRGGYYLIFPIVTAFYFSFLHGSFASALLSALGIEASRRKVKK